MSNFVVGFFYSLVSNVTYNNGLIHTRRKRGLRRTHRLQHCDECQWIRLFGCALLVLIVLPWILYLFVHFIWPELLYSDMNVDG